MTGRTSTGATGTGISLGTNLFRLVLGLGAAGLGRPVSARSLARLALPSLIALARLVPLGPSCDTTRVTGAVNRALERIPALQRRRPPIRGRAHPRRRLGTDLGDGSLRPCLRIGLAIGLRIGLGLFCLGIGLGVALGLCLWLLVRLLVGVVIVTCRLIGGLYSVLVAGIRGTSQLSSVRTPAR